MKLEDMSVGDKVIFSRKNRAITGCVGIVSKLNFHSNYYRVTGEVVGFYIDWSNPSSYTRFYNYFSGLESEYFELVKNIDNRINIKTELFAIKELPCKVCGKNNDVGVSKCWNCECSQ